MTTRVPKLTCPHCNQRAMSIWRKVNTHFAWSGKCTACEGPIGIPSWSFYAWLAVVVVAASLFFLFPERWAVAVILGLLVLNSAIQVYVVPIERRDV